MLTKGVQLAKNPYVLKSFQKLQALIKGVVYRKRMKLKKFDKINNKNYTNTYGKNQYSTNSKIVLYFLIV
jgi:hypothetical protein